MAESTSFNSLHPLIQHYIWEERWETLREIQELAIPAIKPCDRDVIIAASTASGKTEAAYLPALSHYLEKQDPCLVVGVFPLKALINDQFGRLQKLCDKLDIPVWPWHGDISSSVKARFLKRREGVLLITPESLEATLCNKGTAVRGYFEFADYFIIDELHYYIGSERGKQLQSLLHRIDLLVERKTPRIGLSATIGDISLAADYLRPGGGEGVTVIRSSVRDSSIKVLVKAYVQEPDAKSIDDVNADDINENIAKDTSSPSVAIARNIFTTMAGKSNLIFPNSRSEVEKFTYILNTLCDQAGRPPEFWPHHGSLSKEIRLDTESALKNKDRPASAVCTNTLELGIDVGSVAAVAQIGAPMTVSSLRQRLGRSGRRAGESSVLRAYCVEQAIHSKTHITDRLRLGTVKMAAMITLLIDGWFEPSPVGGMHLSTLVMQILSVVSQYGGASAARVFSVLCGPGSPFPNVSKSDFASLLKSMGEKKLIVQDSSGLLLHGEVGEKLVSHYSFYAAFSGEEEYRVVADGRTVGAIPVGGMISKGARILLGGKTWLVESVAAAEKTIYAVKAKSGKAVAFTGGGGETHTVVVRRMREILQGKSVPFLDTVAKSLLEEARQHYRLMRLDTQLWADASLFTWMGTRGNAALGLMFAARGVTMGADDCCLNAEGGMDAGELKGLLKDIASTPVNLDALMEGQEGIDVEKWDWALPHSLLRRSFASSHLDFDEARAWAERAAASL